MYLGICSLSSRIAQVRARITVESSQELGSRESCVQTR